MRGDEQSLQHGETPHTRELGASAWIIDPIDGTANFARGNPHFAISIAYVRDGVPEAGVVYNPVCNELYAARRGRGATLNGQSIVVSGISEMRLATIELGWSTRRPLDDYVAMVQRVFASGAGVLRQGSGALGMAYVAAERTDGYGELHINAWDVLAGLLLWVVIHHTSFGRQVTCVISDREMASALGINVPRMITLTYGFGVALAGLAGVLAAMWSGGNSSSPRRADRIAPPKPP